MDGQTDGRTQPSTLSPRFAVDKYLLKDRIRVECKIYMLLKTTLFTSTYLAIYALILLIHMMYIDYVRLISQ